MSSVKLLTAVILLPFYLHRLWITGRSASEPQPTEPGQAAAVTAAAFAAVLFYLFFVGLQFWPWYLTWLVMPAALLDEPWPWRRRLLAVALCAATPLLYFPFGWQ